MTCDDGLREAADVTELNCYDDGGLPPRECTTSYESVRPKGKGDFRMAGKKRKRGAFPK